MEEKVKYKALAHDAIVDIKISGFFYKRLITLFTLLGQTVSQEEFTKVMDKIKTDSPAESVFELNIHTLMSIIFEIEKSAVEQNKIKEIEIDPETGKPVTES